MLSPKQFPLLIHGCIQVFFTTVDVQAALRAGASACVAFSDALSSGMWAISRVNVSCMFESMYLNLHLMEKQQRKRITNSEKEKEESEGLLLIAANPIGAVNPTAIMECFHRYGFCIVCFFYFGYIRWNHHCIPSVLHGQDTRHALVAYCLLF
ncbi:unnamed protein product [Urochloa humidicola]